MYIQKITYISVTDLDRTVLNLNELETLDYQYRTIDGGDEVEIESSIENLDELLKLGIISQEEYNTIEEEVVDTIFLY
jgi:glutaredoxin-related protein